MAGTLNHYRRITPLSILLGIMLSFRGQLTLCSGNWRNSIYIKCQEEKDAPGCLLAADRDGQPVILGIQQFYRLTGTWIDPAECCGQLTEAGFEALYAQYLLWRCPTSEGHPLRQLCETNMETVP